MFPTLEFLTPGQLRDSGTPDDPPNFDPPDDPPPSSGGELACEVCGVPLHYGGRGRKPKRCDDHKTRTRATGASGDGTRKRGPSRIDSRLAAIADDMLTGAGMVAGGVAPVAPVTAATILLTSPEAIESLLSIAARYPKMLDGMEQALQVIPFLGVAKFLGGVTLAISVDAGRTMPYGLAAEYLGVSKAAEEVGWQPRQPDLDGEFVEGFTAPNAGPVKPPAFSMG